MYVLIKLCIRRLSAKIFHVHVHVQYCYLVSWFQSRRSVYMTAHVLDALHDLQCSDAQVQQRVEEVFRNSTDYIISQISNRRRAVVRIPLKTYEKSQVLVTLSKHRPDIAHQYFNGVFHVVNSSVTSREEGVRSYDIEAAANVLSASVILGRHENASRLYTWLLEQRNEDGDFKRPKACFCLIVSASKSD